MASNELTTLSKILAPRSRGALTIDAILAQGENNSGVNDEARSPESIDRGNVVMNGDELGSTQLVPSFEQPPIQPVAFEPEVVEAPPPAETNTGEPNLRSQVETELTNLLNTDTSGDAQGIRNFYGLNDKEKLAFDLSNEATAIKRDYEARVREARNNRDGKFMGAVQQEIDDITYEGNLLLSEKMFQQSIAQGNFDRATRIANQAIQDAEKADQRRLQLIQTAWNFVQNDLSESEKLEIQNQFKREQDDRDFKQSMMMAEYEYALGAAQREFDNFIALQNLSGGDGSGFGTGFVTPDDLIASGVGEGNLAAKTRELAQSRIGELGTGGERDEAGGALAVFDNAQVLIDLLQNDKVQTGPAVGRSRGGVNLPFGFKIGGTRSLGKTTEEEDAFAAASTVFTANFIKAISGAQVSDNERRFLMAALPDENKQEQTNLVNLVTLSNYIANKAGVTLNMDLSPLVPEYDLDAIQAETSKQDLEYLDSLAENNE